jgi:hypothetical protein
MNLIGALQQELAKLEAEVEADPRLRRIRRIKELLADYQGSEHTNGSALPPQRHPRVRRIRMSGGSKAPSKAQTIRQELISLLREKPAHRTMIFEYLKTKNLMGHEKNPLAQLSAYLSSWRDIVTHDDAGNWSLVEMKAQPHGAQK